ncbi:hypothetical protein Ancab_028346 [Ancistrocladus abbreviatus]
MESSDRLRFTPMFDNSSTIIRSFRSGEQPPAHYQLDVDSFSLVASSLSTDSSFFESTEFFVGGYRWVIQIYPNGNEKDNGHGHISVYLKLCDKLKSGYFINVIFRALFYHWEKNEYLIIQDLREQRFDAKNAICGLSRALPQTVFYDKCSGFLIEDRCTFGAEVFIINATMATSARVSCLGYYHHGKYTCRFENFSELSEDIYSPEFTIEDRTWKLNVHPGGHGAQKDKCLSLYLVLIQAYDLTAGNRLYVEFELHIKNQLNDDNHSMTFKHPFEKSAKACGSDAFVPISDLLVPSKGLVIDDVIIFEVCFKQGFMLKTM